MAHHRSMSACEQREPIVRVREDIDTMMNNLFVHAPDPTNKPMRQRNFPRSFFVPPRDSSNQDLNNISNNFQHVNVSHGRNMSFDLQALTPNWRDSNNNNSFNNNNNNTNSGSRNSINNNGIGNGSNTSNNNVRNSINSNSTTNYHNLNLNNSNQNINNNSFSNNTANALHINNHNDNRTNNNNHTTTSNMCHNVFMPSRMHNNASSVHHAQPIQPTIVPNVNGAGQVHQADVTQAVSTSCLLNLDLEADMARMRQNFKDLDRLRTSIFQPTPTATTQPDPMHAQSNEYTSLDGSNNHLAAYPSSTSAGSCANSGSGSSSVFNSSSSPTLNHHTSTNHVLKPHVSYTHLRQTSVDSGLGYLTYAHNAPKTHHAHHHSVSVMPGYCSPVSETHSNSVTYCSTGTLSTPMTNNDAQANNYHMDSEIDPDSIIPTLGDIDPQLSIEDYINYPLG